MANNKYTNLNADNAVVESLTRFFGFYDNRYRDPFINGNAFIFMTKPLLFIDPNRGSNAPNGKMAYLNMTRDPQFTSFLYDQVMNQADRKIAEMLSYNTEYSQSSFIPLITNEFKNFDAIDVSMEQADSFDTKQGFKETLPTTKTMSEAASTLSISVTEDSNLSFTKMMTLWVNYISNVTDGTFDANPEMVLNGELDYMSSIYYFVLAPDGRTIKYWAKYTGCWPTTIPYSSMRYNKGQPETTDLTLSFVYNVKEDMNPKILEEFNMLSLKLMGTATLESKNYVYSINDQYASIKESPLLNMTSMLNIGIPGASNILESDRRDPLVIYVPASDKGINNDSTNEHFELLFDDSGYKSSFIDESIGANKYYINDTATNFAKNKTYTNFNWDQTDFWTKEILE